ncbi:RalF-like Dot/Icm system translocated protein [Nitzschia inconspicua]|uniref:RalF-like Dot/Icm system translocated protein n=1 Tax=Nitzschia inconspicua TaxID=303405 RepID=A0A9K3Q4A6_9STRA|nr:RalF-like Dot/Icm system translocated protein [Nitzschia inconspicua]
MSFFSAATSTQSVADNKRATNAPSSLSPHYHFIHSMLLPSTVKIQKELRGRRFREIQSKLSEALILLQEYQHEEGPKNIEMPVMNEVGHLPLSNGSLVQDEVKEIEKVDSQENGDEVTTATNDDDTTTDVESNFGDFSRASEQDAEGLKSFGESSQPVEKVTTTNRKPPNEIQLDSNGVEDDPLTRQEMNEAIVVALDAYIMTMEHEQTTNVACEQALECVTQLVIRNYVSGRAGVQDDSSASGSTNTSQQQGGRDQTTNGEPSQMNRLLQGIQKCSGSTTESVQSHVIECLKTLMTSPSCGIHQAAMLLCIRSVFHIYLIAKTTHCRDAARAALEEIVEHMMLRMENSPFSPSTHLNSLFYTDTIILMRSLIKLTSKDLPGDSKNSNPSNFSLASQIFSSSVPTDPLALKNKVLSLELILKIMECAGPQLCDDDRFAHLVQGQLCVNLLKNCMSNNTSVAFVSNQIFLILVYKLKSHLKDEIQVFMTNMFFRVLESENASFAQKALVLESLRSMCKDPVLLTQIFINYDCDLNAMNLYKEIVLHLTKLSGKSIMKQFTNLNMAKKDMEENQDLSLAGSEVLVTILQSFMDALGMTSTSNSDLNDTAGKKIRKALNIEAVATPRNSLQYSTKKIPVMSPKDVRDMNGTDSVGRPSVGKPNETFSVKNGIIAGSSKNAGEIAGRASAKQHRDQNFELGAVKFTLDLKKGLNFFIENQFVQCDAKDIANFFFENKDKLDKTQMGEVLGREPDAAFIKTPPDLDAEKGGPGFFVRILHHYIHTMDFTGLMFDEAIRLFLSGFRLPGEAQKIDRIMEKFAERFTLQNPDVFPSADTAFILAFSVIMLNTDLHNPSIKEDRRMTLDSFLRNNRGIGENGADLPEEFLSGIFERIKKQPFSLKEDDAAREKATGSAENAINILGDSGGLLGAGLFGTSTEERKKEKFEKEREEMVAATQQLLRKRKDRNTKSEDSKMAVKPADAVAPMFDVTWGPIIGILSQVLECSNDERSIAVCLNGFVYAIRISSHSNMSLARETFVNSLAKFTYLGSIKEMKFKNIESIRTLMSIAVTDGEFLGEGWGPVLQCISQLARMRISASGLDSDESFLRDGTNSVKKKETNSKSYFTRESRTDTSRDTEDMNAKAILDAISEQLIDQVFSSSVKLSAQSLAQFIEQLVAVSNAEIEGELKQGITGVTSTISGSGHGGNDGPSIFSMQRLVEVADYNMEVRPRVVWREIWEVMSDFFSKNGCHRNPMVSVFAVDALKQLSMKFLENPESSEYHFQRLFLRPFLAITENPQTRQEICEMILACVDQMINARAKNLQSGWSIFFDILRVSACDPVDKISLHALSILQGTLDRHLDYLAILNKKGERIEAKKTSELSLRERNSRNSNAEDFTGMCRASLTFIGTKDSKSPRPIGVSMRALCHAAIYADLIGAGRVAPPVSGAQWKNPREPAYTYEGLSEEEALAMVPWRTIFDGLAEGVRSREKSRDGGMGNLIQRGSVLALRAILLRHGKLLSDQQLKAVLEQSILPSFQDAVRHDSSPVTSIASESPAVSSLDFLTVPAALPPLPDDEGLMKFEEVFRQMERGPTRPMGPSELLLEATFTDMRNGGDGDLSQAYKFAKKDLSSSEDIEQPFPDSWISTTSPIALGTLTDISTEVIFVRGASGAALWRSTIGIMYRVWCNGDSGNWIPCEAVVRVGTAEVNRFLRSATGKLPIIDRRDASIWANEMMQFYTQLLHDSLLEEQLLIAKLLRWKWREYKKISGKNQTGGLKLMTAHGYGTLEEERAVSHDCGTKVIVETIRLDFGVLYQARLIESSENKEPGVDDFAKLDAKVNNPEAPNWMKLLPALKIRCVAAHYLQQTLLSLHEDEVFPLIPHETIEFLLKTLNRSRELAEDAVKNEDLAHAFQEAMFSEWEMEDMGEEALVKISQQNNTQGSAMFFLTQTAGATNSVIRLLSVLYDYEEVYDGVDTWDRKTFAGQYLMKIMQDIFFKFAESEAKEGHRIDPNVWRNTSESGVKVAVYCTSFASVVVGLLNAMLSFEPSHIERNKGAFYPMVCELINVQSDEIRKLVRRILVEKFGPLLGLGQDTGRGTSLRDSIVSEATR